MDDIAYIKPPRHLKAIRKRTKELGFSMASEPQTGAFLATLAASKPGRYLLELGTGTGLSTAWLLHGMSPDSYLVSVDSVAGVQNAAREVLGADSRVRFVLDDGLEYLAAQSDRCFDLVFADAMPGKYEGLDEALRVVADGGIYVVDDMLPQPNWPEGHAEMVEAFLHALEGRRDFVVTRMNWSTGILVATRRPEPPVRARH